MIPDVWPFALLVLAAFRVTRLLSWDTFPPVLHARERLLRARVDVECGSCHAERADYEPRPGGEWVGLDSCPNCQSTEPVVFISGNSRPLLAEFVECPFCLGAWVSLGFYLAWLVAPTATLVVSVPLALSALVGLAAKNLDA